MPEMGEHGEILDLCVRAFTYIVLKVVRRHSELSGGEQPLAHSFNSAASSSGISGKAFPSSRKKRLAFQHQSSALPSHNPAGDGLAPLPPRRPSMVKRPDRRAEGPCGGLVNQAVRMCLAAFASFPGTGTTALMSTGPMAYSVGPRRSFESIISSHVIFLPV